MIAIRSWRDVTIIDHSNDLTSTALNNCNLYVYIHSGSSVIHARLLGDTVTYFVRSDS